MKYSLFLSLLLTCGSTRQSDRLEKLWETDAVLATPESVLPHAEKNILYVSLIDGEGWDEDRKGGIAKLKTDGSGYDSTWITGLNAPKGLGIHAGKLYVADIHSLVVVDIENGRVDTTIRIEGATGLNDVTVSNEGVVFVSDMKQGTVWQLVGDTARLYLENLENVNGLKSIGPDLYIGAGKKFLKADAQKQLSALAELPESIDGIEPVSDNEFLVSAWTGYLYLVKADGSFETLLDTRKIKHNVADIGYDPKERVIYIPTFKGNSVAAYHLR